MKRTSLARKTSLARFGELKRTGELSRGTRKRKARVPDAARRAARARTDSRCAVCGSKRSGHLQLHHTLDEALFPEHARESLNLCPVCPYCHANHTSAHRRIRRDELPPEVVAWALALPDPALAWFERMYPPSIASPGASA